MRGVVRWFGVWVLLAALQVGGAAAAVPLVLGHNAPLGGPQDAAARSFVAELNRLMPGHFLVDLRGGLTVGTDADIFQQVRIGAVDVAICATLSFSNQVPELGVLDMPFLFRDRTHVSHVLDGPIGDQIGHALVEQGLANLAYGELGFRQLTNNVRPVAKAADLEGLKLRIAPSDLYVMSFKAMGATTVAMGIGEVFGGLRDGRIDGQENPLQVIKANRFDEVQKYLSLTGHVYAATMYLMNASALAELSPEEQAAIRQAARVSAAASRAAGAEQDRKLAQLLQQSGMMVTTEIDRDSFIKALAPAQPEFERRFGADLIARIRATP
jgi:tripartite ATP-independent transporter DctP family solute receptor